MLRDALLTGNVQLRYNSHRDPARDRRRRTARRPASSTSTPTASRRSVAGDRFVLAASPIESARLCLLSDPGGAGLGNSSGMVGRNLMFHLQTIGVGIFQQRLHGERGRSVTTGISDFRGVPNDPASARRHHRVRHATPRSIKDAQHAT